LFGAPLTGLGPNQVELSFLDSEQRIIGRKAIKLFILHAKKTAFVIKHDFIMVTYLADRVIVFESTLRLAIAATATPYFFCCPCLIYSKDLIEFVSLQTTIATHWDEQIPQIARNSVPSRPIQLPPTSEKT
jgi:hypothetical protein